MKRTTQQEGRGKKRTPQQSSAGAAATGREAEAFFFVSIPIVSFPLEQLTVETKHFQTARPPAAAAAVSHNNTNNTFATLAFFSSSIMS